MNDRDPVKPTPPILLRIDKLENRAETNEKRVEFERIEKNERLMRLEEAIFGPSPQTASVQSISEYASKGYEPRRDG